MTDKVIIDYIKKDIVEGNTGDFLTLDIYDSDARMKHCFSEQFFDDMMKTLFDFSLTKNIVAIGKEGTSNLLSYNGQHYAIINYSFIVSESRDHQTNITPRLMKFIEVAFTRSGLDRLAYPMYRNRIEYELRGFSDGNPMIYIPPEDPWETLEKYMEGMDEQDPSQ